MSAYFGADERATCPMWLYGKGAEGTVWAESTIRKEAPEFSCFLSDLSAVAKPIGIWGGRHGLRRDRIKALASAGARESID